MKSKYLLIAMLFGVTVSTAACKCVTCSTSGSSQEVEICRKDFDTKQQYDAAVAVTENSGWQCN